MIEKKCDVVILGGGGSGLVAAVRAAERGCKVILLEKTKVTGGGMLLASTMRTFGSQWQKERNIPDISYEFMRQGMDATLWQLDPELVRTAILATGKFFDWYSKYELPEVMERYHPGTYVFDDPVTGQVGPQIDGFHNGSGRLIMATMRRKAEEFGVEILLQTAATDVEVSEGRISAVLAQGPDGDLRIEAPVCMIASGSWIRRKDIIAKVLPAYLNADVLPSAHENPAYTGEAIDFGEKVGAEIDWKNFCLRIMGPICSLGDGSKYDKLCHIGSMIMVDLNARRFTCEPMAPRIDPFTTGHILLQHPKARTVMLFSKNVLEHAIVESHANAGSGVFGVPELPELSVINGWFEEKLQQGSSELGMADTIEALAEQVGLDPAALRATVDEYNASCAEGRDWNFCKDPKDLIPLSEGPFYALTGKMMTDGAFGGIRVNARMQALKDGGGVVDGLYVLGDAASGRHISLGGLKKQVINDMPWALVSGYVAGGDAADVLGK